MAEEVEISNVGGDGVASEVTLAKLTAAIENMARASGVDPRSAAAKAQEMYTKSLGETDDITHDYTDSLKKQNKETKTATERLKKLGDASLDAVGSFLGSVTGGLTGLATELVTGGTRLSDFTQHIPIVGGLLGGFAGYIDNTVDTFRTLSATGAAFGNDMLETQRSAGQLGLSLDEFAGLISNNASNLSALGGSVTQGAERFKKMNDNIKKSGDFNALKNMGFTVEEINEGMGDYIDLQRRLGTLEGKSTQELAAGSADYLKQIDLLAKVTGKTREEAEKALREQAQDAAIRGMMAQFEEGSQELANFRTSLGIIDEVGGAAGTAMKDLLDGMPSGPETAQFLNMMGDAGPAVQEALKQIGDGADPQVLLDAMKAGGGELEKFANMDADARAQYIAALRNQQPAMAEFLDTATRMVDIGNRDLDAATAEQDKRNKVTDAFATFEDAIREARGIIQEAFVNSGIFEDAAGYVKSFSDGLKKIIENPGFKKGINDMFASIQTFIDDWNNFGFSTALFGDEEKGVNGLIKNLFGADGAIATALGGADFTITDGIKAAAKGFADSMFDFEIPWGTLFVGGLVGIGAAIAAPVLAIPAGIAAAITAVFGIQFMKDLLSDAWDGLKAAFTWTAETAGWLATGVSGLFSEAWTKITNFFSMDTVYKISDLTSEAWNTVTGWFGFGEGEATFAISKLATDAWQTVTGFFTFDTFYKIGDLAETAWTTVTDFFTLDNLYKIGDLADTAWTTITGFFTLDNLYKIGDLADTAWATVTGWFGFTTDYKISELAAEAWRTVTGFFSFGSEEGGTSFKITDLVTTAWSTITGFFSLENFQIPSISSMFQGIIDSVKGFFTFDFEMPNFKSYLPTWLGGEGKSLFGEGTETSASTDSGPVISATDLEAAAVAKDALVESQTAIGAFANIQGLQDNLDAIKNGLDTDSVIAYTNAMRDLVEELQNLNEELSSSQNSRGRGRTTQNAASVMANMETASGPNNDQLLGTMNSVLAVLSEIRDIELSVKNNTRNIAVGNIASGSVSVLPG